MTAALAIGLTIVAAELAVLAVGLWPVLRDLHRTQDEFFDAVTAWCDDISPDIGEETDVRDLPVTEAAAVVGGRNLADEIEAWLEAIS